MTRQIRRSGLIACAIATTTAVAALVGPLMVNSDSVTLRQSPSSIAPSAGKFGKGTQFTVLEDRGTFARVKNGATEGWLRVADLEPKRLSSPGLQSGPLSLTSSAGRASESASGKGLNDIAISYSQTSGVSTVALQKLFDQRNALVDGGQVQQFAKDGNVGKR